MSKKDQKLEDAARAIIKQQFERGMKFGANGVAGAVYEMLTSSSSKEEGFDKVLEFCKRSLDATKINDKTD